MQTQQVQETIVCCSSPSTSVGSITFHDIRTGATLATFKQANARTHGTDLVETKGGQGGFILSAQQDKSILNVYNYQKDQVALKIVLSERLSCIAVDPRGAYCASGTSQGRIYLWETSSGILFNAWEAHYRQVNVLRFTPDGAALISGSDDSSVSVWSVARLVDNDLQNELVTPYCTLSDHTLPITDILCSFGTFPTNRILTSSLDHSVKIWDLLTQTLLSTFQFPRAIATITWDAAERIFFAASVDGFIHQVNLFSRREDKFAVAVGGGGAVDPIRIGDESSSTGPTKKRLIPVGEPVTAMTISLTGSSLLVGTEGGLVHLYDVASHQMLRTISSHKGSAITFLRSILKPIDLVGHVSLNLHVNGATDTKDVIPVRPIQPFQRIKDTKPRDAHEVTIMLPAVPSPHNLEYSGEELLEGYAFFVHGQNTESEGAPLSTNARVQELEVEVTKLKEQLGKAKAINDTMWQSVVHKLVESSEQSSVDAEEQHRRKRGRV
ncbi:WD40 repeat-like protein [Thelephora ganbajun]|uniref:WD40 repeat-like protein n=1 Tax=Thelephora ganbajun TaxID=370292 RepID=A0ACB6ZGG4_THEGA|nr:WD40 repeat-like protein [Thelephora ganbajun]